MINKLMIFERKIMRKILGPTRSDNGYWRIKTNQEINDILQGQNRMSKRPTGRPKLRWEDDILEDIKSMNVCNWKNITQNRDRWKSVVEQARTLNRL